MSLTCHHLVYPGFFKLYYIIVLHHSCRELRVNRNTKSVKYKRWKMNLVSLESYYEFPSIEFSQFPICVCWCLFSSSKLPSSTFFQSVTAWTFLCSIFFARALSSLLAAPSTANEMSEDMTAPDLTFRYIEVCSILNQQRDRGLE